MNDDPGAFTNRKNIYVCKTCAGHIVTVDVDKGATPFMVDCQATPGCKGMMRSSFYRVFDQSMKAGFEWYRPTALQHLSTGERAHVDKGGLLLRSARQETT